MTYLDKPVISTENLINTSLSSERYGLEKLLIRDELQRCKNKLEYARNLTEEGKEQLRELEKRLTAEQQEYFSEEVGDA